jgi:hypothetical protein
VKPYVRPVGIELAASRRPHAANPEETPADWKVVVDDPQFCERTVAESLQTGRQLCGQDQMNPGFSGASIRRGSPHSRRPAARSLSGGEMAADRKTAGVRRKEVVRVGLCHGIQLLDDCSCRLSRPL